MTEAVILLAVSVALLAGAVLILAWRLGVLGLAVWIHIVHLSGPAPPPDDTAEAEWWKHGEKPPGDM